MSSKHIHSPAYIAAIRREVQEMTGEQLDQWIADAMESDRSWEALHADIEREEIGERFE